LEVEAIMKRKFIREFIQNEIQYYFWSVSHDFRTSHESAKFFIWI